MPLAYHHSHFLVTTLDFTSFFIIAFLRAAYFYYSWALYLNSFCINSFIIVPLGILRNNKRNNKSISWDKCIKIEGLKYVTAWQTPVSI